MMPASWFVHTLTRKRITGTTPTGKGDPTLGTADLVVGRLEKRRILTKRGDGQEVFAQHVFATQTEVKMTDVFWFPAISGEAADDTTLASRARRPLSIDIATTKTGLEQLWQVYF